MMTDEELLGAYHKGRSEAAFTELVERHVDLVYSTALRTVGEPQLAQDVAQAVFVHLARKPGSIRKASALPGWLYRVASGQAANAVRSERRRRQREQEAVKLNSTTGEEPPAWGEFGPLLEEAMQTLGRRDQDAVVLRFFHGQSLRQVGEALDLSEDAAQKRLSRALDRLRNYLVRRGVKVSAGVLASGIATHAVHAAPAGVGTAISTAVIASGAALHGAGTLGFAKLALAKGIIMTTTQKISVTAVLTLAVGTGVFEAYRAGQLRQERDDLTARLQGAQAQIELLQRNMDELVRQRGDVARLEGTWVGQEVGGPQGECRMTITGNRLQFQGARANEWYKGTLTLNESTTPKQALIQIEECAFPQFVNKSARSIYKLEANTLTIAGNEPGTDVVPSEFRRSNRTRVFVYTKQ